MKKLLYIALIAAFASSPLCAFAQSATTDTSSNTTTGTTPAQYQSDGVFGCNRTSASASSVAVFAGSGTYVPVDSSSLDLNTGYIVYLDCTLNPLVSALSGSATAGLVQKVLTTFNTGNNGNPQYSTNINSENQKIIITSGTGYLQSGALSNLNSALQSTVQSAVARGFAQSIQQPGAVLGCNVSDLSDFLNGTQQTWSWSDWNTVTYNPACNPMGAAQLTSDQLYANVNNAVQNNMTELQWGNGVYPVVDANGNVVTPGAIVLNQSQQALQAGLTKTENANSIGQLVGALFAGIGAQAISSAQGLSGITQSSNGQASYISQVVSQASATVRQNATNAAITTLNGVLGTLSGYLNALNTTANTLINASNTLRSTENQCWNTIIQDVCVAGSFKYMNGTATCTEVSATSAATSSAGTTLHIATSTAFSNAVIQAQISPLGQSIGNQIAAAQSAQKQVNQLVAGVTNTTSQDAQTLALEQLDQLTASNSFPQTSNMQSAQQQSTTIGTTMQTLVNQVVNNWEGYDNNGTQDLPWDGTVTANTVGWCDYNNASTLSTWEGVWAKALQS